MQVLVADDIAVTRRLVQLWLQERGHDVECVGDGAAAWEAYARLRPSLVVLDWQMPGLDGLEVCRRIRAADPRGETFILMVTARESLDDVVRAFDAGADDYVTKPFAPVQFRARLVIAERRVAQRAAHPAPDPARTEDRSLAVGERVGAIRDEIGAPLATLLDRARRVAQRADLPDALREDLEAIVAEAHRAGEAVTRLSTLVDG